MRAFPLSAAKAGITRLRDKGGANKDSLYDLVNGYVTQARSIRPRPGSTRAYSLPLGTKGLCAFRNKLHVFSSDVVSSLSPDVVINILRHPQTGSTDTLKEIWFAAPFLGFLYVVAEWESGEIYHYWLQDTGTWQANHVYLPGEVIQPTTPNGYSYQASRLGDPNPLWVPNVNRALGEVVEPTTPNGYKYTVVIAAGDDPRSGATEPTWIAAEGALVYETTNNDAPPASNPDPNDGTTTPPPQVVDRYSNQGGYPKCVVATMWVDADRLAGEIMAGDLVDAHSPELGFHKASCKASGEVCLQECVRITTDNGSWTEVSKTTPVNFAEATQDMEDGKWAFAPYVIGQNVLTKRGVSQVVEVVDIGEKPVKPLDFGGVSFVSGGDQENGIYTHNMAKFSGDV